eukprot:Protomagalhaensia_sp_Gyna_25__200@NODE_1097_length_2194_cov_64_613457_g867_i0_p5_GENE_NODE_1097_length_2194_cov_64_613457_g867_i0NODE_1097_length_2194_cov_64_613457_g867_i0_p5_ORF_typecomplete_len108_score13_035HT_transport_N/PF03491_13/0_16_NODE_1097_length_2194_cov_64_613457_g867_i09661289
MGKPDIKPGERGEAGRISTRDSRFKAKVSDSKVKKTSHEEPMTSAPNTPKVQESDTGTSRSRDTNKSKANRDSNHHSEKAPMDRKKVKPFTTKKSNIKKASKFKLEH